MIEYKNFKAYLEAVGVVSVLATLLFLAFELRQSNQIARSQIAVEVSGSYAEISDLVYTNDAVAALRVKAQDSDFIPDELELEKLRAIARRYIGVSVMIENAYSNGHQSRAQLEGSFATIEILLEDMPGLRTAFAMELEDRPQWIEAFESMRHLNSVLARP